MMVVRPSRIEDLDGLMELATKAGIGLTTLPASKKVLAEHLADSNTAFERDVTRPRGERYLLVMENMLSGKLVGCAGLVGRVGGFDPFYSYAIENIVKESAGLGVQKDITTLNLVEDHKGPSEIGTLFVDPEFRQGGHGRLMSLSRFLFMAACPQRFTKNVIAEMRGNVDPEVGSPFWDAIGRHFFEMRFVDADKRSAANKQFIADLMPKHPIYLPMLPEAAQAVIGQVHPEAKPALKLLKQEGFQFGNEVDIFDAGPLYRVATAEVRTIKNSREGIFSRALPEEPEGPLMIICNNAQDFRATLGRVEVLDDGSVGMTSGVALSLGLHLGQSVRFVTARPTG